MLPNLSFFYNIFSYFAIGLLVIGSVQDFHKAEISPLLNKILLGGLIIGFIFCLIEFFVAPVMALSRVAVSVIVLLMLYLTWLGPADAKFIILSLLVLNFSSPVQPLFFVIACIMLWIAFPTKKAMKNIEPLVVVALAVLILISHVFGGLLAFLYLGYMKYNEMLYFETSQKTYKSFPFLHIVLIIMLLHFFVPFW